MIYHHYIFSYNGIVRNNTICPNTTIVSNFYISTITKISMPINCRNFTTILKNATATEYSDHIPKLAPISNMNWVNVELVHNKALNIKTYS